MNQVRAMVRCIMMNDPDRESRNEGEVRGLADELREAFHALSPFIEKHTSIVCPDCTDLCCKDKHAIYDKNDRIFLNALNVDTPEQHERPDSEPCRHMRPEGCCLERWMRPFRCTHFFCDPLLASLENEDPKLYRAFVEYLRYLVDTRQRFLADPDSFLPGR